MHFSQICEILPIRGYLPPKSQFSGGFGYYSGHRPFSAPDSSRANLIVASDSQRAKGVPFYGGVFRMTYRFRDISIQSYRISRKIDFSGAARVAATTTDLL